MVPRQALRAQATEPLQVTARQLQLLQAIHRLSLEHGRSPSIRELADYMDRSPSTIHQHIKALERRQCLERSGRDHGLRLRVQPEQLELPESGIGTLLPLKGILFPGRPLQRRRPPYQRLSIGGETRRGDYLVQLAGDRLQHEGLHDGDLLVIRPGSAGESPAIVQFEDGSADIRRVTTLRDGALGLLPPRAHLESRRGARRAPGVLVQGRVIRIIRRFE